MTLTVLVSFSLLALVVTARPLPDNPQFAYARPAELQSAVQAIFESRTKQSVPDLLTSSEDHVHVHLTSTKDQQAYLSQLDSSAVKALIPIGHDSSSLLSEDEQKLRDMLGTSDGLDDVEGESRPLEDGDADEVPEAVSTVPHSVPSSRPLIIIAVSATLAFLTVVCVGVSLYAFYYIRASLFASHTAWDLLPKLENQRLLGAPVSDETDEKTSGLGLILHAGDDEKPTVPVGILIDIDGDASTTDDEYEDALDASAAATPRPTPRIPQSALPPMAPLLIPLPPSPSSSPRPAWAVLAPEDQPQTENRGTAPALDFALAMQLRPGLGLGADPAWLVRFLMAMFGWVAMLVGGGRRDTTQSRRLVGM